MSFFTFNIAGNALDAYQEALNVTSDNIANVSTPGASRQSAVVSEAIPISGSPYYSAHLGSPGTRGEGAVVDQIARIHENSYDALYRSASSSQYYYSTQSQQLTTLESNFGEPNSGINAAFAKLQSAVKTAAGSVSTPSDRTPVILTAQTFATALNAASSSLGNQKQTLMQQAGASVTQANKLIDTIASLNGQIRALTATGDNPNTYLDQRDAAIDALSQITNVTTVLQSNGSSTVSVDGRALVTDTIAYHLAAPLIGTAANGTSTFVIGFANDKNPSNPAPVPLSGGQLGAFADLYNNKLIPYGQSLDNFASAAASEMNRIAEAGVDLNGNAGTPLFIKSSGQQSITAASISVAITDQSQLPLGLVSTAAGSLVSAMNSANNTVSTSTPLDNNPTLSNPPLSAPLGTGSLTGTLTVAVDGITQTFAYDTSATGNADTLGDFMTAFNAGHYGVTASFDGTTQKIAFTRDPNNIDEVHRGIQGQNAPTASFTITDSGGPPGTTPPSPPAAPGAAATGLLQALGATNINGIAQTPRNAYGEADNGGANAFTKLFSQNVGLGALQTTAAAVSAPGPGPVTITQPPGSPGAFANLVVGQVLTVVNATTGTTQNVPITAINLTTGTVTVTATAPINLNDQITTVQNQTLAGGYQGLIAQMGQDLSTVNTGTSTQTALSASIDTARQGVDGINIDEETQNLLKFQSAYTAAAKTMSTLNAVMQTTLGLIN